VFIIVSGFVITHVILERDEAYPVYLVKRFARIFPLFAVTCWVGFVTNDLLAAALSSPEFGDREFAEVTRGVAASNHDHLFGHFVAHATMLHGAIPHSVLPYSEYAFNMPAWSVSLEWQFYVLAPLVVLVLRDKQKFILALAAGAAIVQFVFTKYFLGTFHPGALPAAACYFAIGILSRLAYSKSVETFPSLRVAVVAAIVLFPIAPDVRPVLVWMVVYFGLPAVKLESASVIGRIYELALNSRLAVYFGSRSYSIYLVHYPIISIVVWLFFARSTPLPNMLLLSCICIPLTVVISELAYRTIESPGIALGKRVATSMQRWRTHRTLIVKPIIDSHFPGSHVIRNRSTAERADAQRLEQSQSMRLISHLLSPSWKGGAKL
jgi:peptidoglycan/LPS O-acetylase OafA/YrhL